MRVLQCALGAASCVLLAIAGSQFFSRPAGRAAGALLAIYPPAIFFDGLIHKSSPDLFLISVLLVGLAACARHAQRRWLIVSGIAIGALMGTVRTRACCIR